MNNKEKVASYVHGRLEQWRNQQNEHLLRADLANLRRGTGKKPGDLPELWALLFCGFPEELMSKSGEPTPAEWAVSGALTLYALHSQGEKHGAQAAGQSLGAAAGILACGSDGKNRDGLKAVQRRFNACATARSMPECMHHLRGLIQLLRSRQIPLDYARLAADLYEFQMPGGGARVRLRWGQDFCRYAFPDKKGKDDNDNE